MTLHPPFKISARLMAAVQIDGAWVSIGFDGATSDGRARYKYALDLPDGREFEANDLKSGVGGGSIQSGMESLLCFLGAAGESYRYWMSRGMKADDKPENMDLFPEWVSEWAYQHSDEIEMIRLEIEESGQPAESEAAA